MRSPWLIAALVLVPSLRAQTARLEQADSGARIVATVSKTARVPPDRATVYVIIEGQSESPSEAAQRATQKLEAVTRALHQAGVAADMSTTVPYGASVAPNVGGFPGPSPQPSYVARHVVRVQFGDLQQLMPAVTAALAAGATSVSAPVFESQTLDATRQRLYADALATARREAEALAAALGGRLGSLVEVSSTAGPSPTSNQGFMLVGNRYDYSGPVQPPEILATATVTIRYRFLMP